MGLGLKIALFGFAGFMGLAGIGGIKVAMNGGLPERTPAEQLASAKRYFDGRCSDVTRNRYINGKLGRGPSYCKCIIRKLDQVVDNPDEYRYLAKLQSGVGKERWFFQETHITTAVKLVRKEFMPLLGPQGIRDANKKFFPSAKLCTRSV